MAMWGDLVRTKNEKNIKRLEEQTQYEHGDLDNTKDDYSSTGLIED